MTQEVTTSPQCIPDTRRVAVIGGGVSGLAAAFRLLELRKARGQPVDVTLFEAGSQTGGVIGTRRIDGYLVELGADMFITNPPYAVDLCRRLGLENELIPTEDRFRRSLVLHQGKPVSVPESFQLLSPVEIWPVLKSPLFTWPGKLRMALEYFLPRSTSDADESLAHFVRRRFGREALERLVQPLVGGIYTADPERLSLHATMSRFRELERTHGSVIRGLRKKAASRDGEAAASGARYGMFATLRNGVDSLLETLRDRVAEGATVRVGTPVSRLTPNSAGGYSLTLPAGVQERFDAVVLALPAYRIADLLDNFSEQLVTDFRKLEYASTAIVVSGYKLSDIEHPLDAFGLVIPAIEKRKILAVSFTSRKFPGRAPEGRIILRTFVGGAMQPELLQRSDAEIQTLVQSELSQILGVRGAPEFCVVARWDRAMPQYYVGHVELVSRIEAAIATHRGLALAGNAWHGVGIPDCVHSGEVAGERVFREICDSGPDFF